MKKTVLLSTDTLHHRYFINKLREGGFQFHAIIFETTSIQPPFKTEPFFKAEKEKFEEEHFFHKLSSDISGEKLYNVENINNLETIDLIKKIRPTLGIVFGTRKLNKRLINQFTEGLYNIHRGIAQKYRGLDSDLWAIYHNDIEDVGVTIHKIDLSLDTGGIVKQDITLIPADSKIYHLRYLTTITATNLCIQFLKDYYAGCVKISPQKDSGRYYSFMPLCIKELLIKKFEKQVKKIYEQ